MIDLHYNFLSEHSLNLIDNKIEELFNSRGSKPLFSSSVSHWEKNLIDSSIPILRYTLKSEDLELLNALKSEIEGKINYFVEDVIIHICPRLSYIPWHNDGNHKAAISIYISKKWDPNWGGYFLYADDQKNIRGVIPERNLAIFQKGGTPHSVSLIGMNADYRISIQCFLRMEKKLM